MNWIKAKKWRESKRGKEEEKKNGKINSAWLQQLRNEKQTKRKTNGKIEKGRHEEMTKRKILIRIINYKSEANNTDSANNSL